MLDTDLEVVADVYLNACRKGEWPTMAVAELYDIPRSTANKWVIRARKAGLIPATTTGRTPKKYQTCPSCGAPPSRWRHELA